MNRIIPLALICCVSVSYSIAKGQENPNLAPDAVTAAKAPKKAVPAPAGYDPGKVVVTVIDADARQSEVIKKVVDALEKSGITKSDLPADENWKDLGITARLRIQQETPYEKITALIKALQYAGVQKMAFTKPTPDGKNLLFLVANTPQRSKDIQRIDRAARHAAKENDLQLDLISTIPAIVNDNPTHRRTPDSPPATTPLAPDEPEDDPYFAGSDNASLRGFSFKESDPPEISDLENSEISPQELRDQIVELKKEYDGNDKRAYDLAASLRQTPDARRQAELKSAVMRAFRSRQQLLQAELLQMQYRLKQAQANLIQRNQLRTQIVERRVQDLLNPQWEWEGTQAFDPLQKSESTNESPKTMSPSAEPIARPASGVPVSKDNVFVVDENSPGLTVLGDPDADGMVAVTFQPSPHSSLNLLKTGQMVFISQTLRPTKAGYNHTPIIASECVLQEFWKDRKRAASNQPVVVLVEKTQLWDLTQAEKRGALEVHPKSPRRPNTTPSRKESVQEQHSKNTPLPGPFVTIAVSRVVNNIDIGDLTVATGVVVSETGLILVHFDDASYLDHKEVHVQLEGRARIPLVIAEKSDCGLLALKPKTLLPKPPTDLFAISTAQLSTGADIYILEGLPGRLQAFRLAKSVITQVNETNNTELPTTWRIRPNNDSVLCNAVVSENKELIGIPMMRAIRSMEDYHIIPVTRLGSILPNTFGHLSATSPLVVPKQTELEGVWHQVAYSDGEGVSHEKHQYNRTYKGDRSALIWSDGKEESRIEVDTATKTVKRFREDRGGYSVDHYELLGDRLIIRESGFAEGDRITVYERGDIPFEKQIPTAHEPKAQ